MFDTQGGPAGRVQRDGSQKTLHYKSGVTILYHAGTARMEIPSKSIRGGIMEVKNQPIAKAALLIRRPVAEVFEAFVDPDVITKFWFEKSTGRLGGGKTVQWHWELYNASTEVRVKAIEENTGKIRPRYR